MVMDYLESILELSVIVVMQVVCLFQYIKYRKRGYVYLSAFFLCSFVSTYYWTAYLLIMRDSPNVSDGLSYLGWNVAFMTMLAFILHMKSPEERRYFHPLMLLPIPLNIYQLTLYLPYGGLVNNVYQVLVMTGIAVFSIQGLCWYWKHRADGAKPPWIAVGGLLYACCEFGMWTSSCFGWPSDCANPYYYFSMLCSLDFIFIGWALDRAYGAKIAHDLNGTMARQQKHMKIIYLAVVAICCVGGIGLGTWMRDVLIAGTRGLAEARVFDIIPAVLFLCSMVVVAYAVAIIFMADIGEKAAESDELREAKAVAEQSNASKSEFLANMSHEIRTPINAMLGMNEIILRESLEARDRMPREREAVRRVFGDICAYSGNIDSAGKNLLAIINDILDFSKIEAGKLELAESEYRLSSVLNDVSNMILFKAQSKGLEFRVDMEDDIPDGLYGDEVRVRQIITNILNNAVKYTNSGSVRLSVRCGEGGAVEIGETLPLVVSVADTGIGIRQEDIDRLFDKFERVDLERNSAIEGTGLGLAITRSLLALMGGSIAVESEYGVGSTFTVVIPQRVVSREPVGNFKEKFEKSIHDTKARAESFQAPNARILVVDDTRMNLTVVRGLLKNTRIRVDTADSGKESIEMARMTRYDLILMDQRMPGMDGTEALARIREDGLNRGVPVICLTADAVSGAKERYIAAGFDDYLTKPIDGVSLENTLARYLPRDKVVFRSDASDAAKAGEPGQASGEDFEPLRAVGIDPKIGLGFCQNDGGFYRTMLMEYSQAAPHKARGLRELYAQRDWENYGILAHALKSTSRMIGATALAEVAQRIEKAAGAGDEAAVDREHADMMAQFEAVTDGIRRFTGEWDDAPAADVLDAPEPDMASDEVIIEFMPGEE